MRFLSLTNELWYFFGHGAWQAPASFDEIRKQTSCIQYPYLIAGGVSDEQLQEIQTYPMIGGLAIVGPELTVSSTCTLQALPHLRELILCGPPIADDFLLRLPGLVALQSITLINTSCMEDSVRTFLQSLPECQIYRENEYSIYPTFDRLELQPVLISQ